MFWVVRLCEFLYVLKILCDPYGRKRTGTGNFGIEEFDSQITTKACKQHKYAHHRAIINKINARSGDVNSTNHNYLTAIEDKPPNYSNHCTKRTKPSKIQQFLTLQMHNKSNDDAIASALSVTLKIHDKCEPKTKSNDVRKS